MSHPFSTGSQSLPASPFKFHAVNRNLAAEAAEPDTVSGFNKSFVSNNSAAVSFSQSVKSGFDNLKRQSIGIFGGGLKLRRASGSLTESRSETVEDVLNARFAHSPHIGHIDILRKIELDFQADMVAFESLIHTHCIITDKIRNLLDLVAFMNQTAAVISESHSNVRSDWPWKNTTANYTRFFALIASANEGDELFFQSNDVTLKLEARVVQKLNDYLYKILARPIWLRFFLQVASKTLTFEFTENFEFAMNQIQALVTTVLQLTNIQDSDGFNDMVALEKLMDASSCLAVDGSLDTKKSKPFNATLFLNVPSYSLRHRSSQPIPLPPKLIASFTVTEVVWDGRKRVAGKAGLGGSLQITCTQGFVVIGRGDSSGGGVKMVYVPVGLEKVSAVMQDHYVNGIDNVVEINLANSTFVVVQVPEKEERLKLCRCLNSVSGAKKPVLRKIQPDLWLVDKPIVDESSMTSLKPSSSSVSLSTESSTSEIKPQSTHFQCLCIPYLAKDGEWEKLAKCDFLIVTDADGGKPRIVLAIEATKMPIACIDVLVELEVKPAGEKEILVTMQNLSLKTFSRYMIRVKDAQKLEEVVSSIQKIKQSLTSIHLETVSQFLIRGNIPDFIKACTYLTPSLPFFVTCVTTVKTGSATYPLGLTTLSLKTLESPIGDFKIMTVTAGETIVLESIITTDMLIQDCRTVTSALIKILFASKPGVEYHLELVSSVDAKEPVDLVVSQVVVSYLVKNVVPYERVFQGDVKVESGIVRSASCLLGETGMMAESPTRMFSRFHSARNLGGGGGGFHGKRVMGGGNAGSTSTAGKVGGWVAAQVRFFNGLAQRGAGSSSDSKVTFEANVTAPVMMRSKAVDMRNVAPVEKTLGGQVVDDIDEDVKKWIKYFTCHTLTGSLDIVFPPKNCPVELLKCWIFIPRAGKLILASTPAFDERLFRIATKLLEPSQAPPGILAVF